MNKNMNRVTFFVLITLYFIPIMIVANYGIKPPRLTVIFVVDQFAYHYIDKLRPYFKHGLKFLLDNGVHYTDAHQPAGQPGTATGHASLSTGTQAKDHGFVGNSWYMNGKKTACDDDASPDSFVLSPEGVYDYGKSSHMLMVDTLSDQCVLQSEPTSSFASCSISLKSRSAIATAGKKGQPFWIDEQTGLFTSSKAYCDKLPDWINAVNNRHALLLDKKIVWQRMYPMSRYAYRFFNIDNYDYTRMGRTMLNRPLLVRDESNSKNPGHLFEKTPYANKLLLDCAQECIKTHVSRKHRGRLLLWVCLSPLDKVGHEFGPQSMEVIDMIYHIDKQIQQFIRGVYRTIGKHETAFVLTADHGIMPIPELLHKDGLKQAHRIERIEFVKKINIELHKNYQCEDVVLAHKGQELVLDIPQMDGYDTAKKDAIISDIKKMALQEPGIKQVWSAQELLQTYMQPHTIESNIKNQLFEGRTGSIVVQTCPYTVITHWSQGASHKTPYDYDTHVPLVLYFPGRFEKREVHERVYVQQLAKTLARILEIPSPSASTYEILPQLFDADYR